MQSWPGSTSAYERRPEPKGAALGLCMWQASQLQSSAVPMEHHSAAFKAYLPSAQKALKLDAFNLLSDLAFLRFNCSHFNNVAQGLNSSVTGL